MKNDLADVPSLRKRPSARPDEPEEPVALELIGVLLALFGLLLGSAIVTLAPERSPRGIANVTGALGRSVAEGLTLSIGLGAYVLAGFLVAWGIACLRGRSPRNWGRKALMAPLFAGLLAILAALVLRRLPAPGLWRAGPGGFVGAAFAPVLFKFVGRAAGLLTAGLSIAVLLLATDFRLGVLFEKAGLSSRVRPRRNKSPVPALAGVGAGDGEDLGGPGGLDASPAGLSDGDLESESDLDDDAPPEFDRDEDARALLDDASADAALSRHFADEEAAEGRESSMATDDDDDLNHSTEPVVTPPPPPPILTVKQKRTPLPPKRYAGTYEFPPSSLLEPGESVDPEKVRSEIERNAAVLATTLRSFGIETRVVAQRRGPVITFYELELEAGTRINRVATLDKDLAVALKSESVRVVAPIPGKNTIGVEVPNTIRDSVRLLDLIEEGHDRIARRAMPLFLGKDAMGEPIIEDLAAMPHMLIAGATGSGKSVCVNSILLSLLMTRTPDEVKVILIDPKQVELSFFEGIPHLLTPVVTNMKKAAQILEWAVAKMEQRYDLLLRCGVRNIAGYNAIGPVRLAKLREDHSYDATDAPELMPYVVIVVDELADLMLQHGKDVEIAIIRLAAKSRAVGIHLILATQRPSVDVITGLIKSNMPMRMSFKVSSMIDSRVILDHKGAEKLLGRGDTLFIPPGSSVLKRAQGTFISDAEVKSIVDFVKEKAGPAEYTDILGETAEGLGDPNEEDEIYDDAARAVLMTKLGSASMLQRKFGIGYTRASRLIDMMCDHRVVGPHKGSKARELLVTLEEWEALRIQKEAERAAAPIPTPMPEEDLSGIELGATPEDDGVAEKGSDKDTRNVSSPWD